MDEMTSVEFRDGARLVPSFLAALMHDMKTHQMTYEQAIEKANRRAESDYLNAQQDKLLAAHFKELR